MLLKSKISLIKIHTEEWRAGRLGKFTSSKAADLMTDSALDTYVRKKVGEEMTGISSEKEVDVEATRHGLLHEVDSLRIFAKKMNLDFLVMQQLITAPGSRFGSTPDALIVKSISPDGKEYDAEPVESKSPPTFDNYSILFECARPLHLKKAKKEYYWQVLDQMDEVGSKIGHFIAYHPDFRSGNFRHIVFDVGEKTVVKGKTLFPLYDDLKELRERKKLAEQKFNDLRDRYLAEPAYTL